MTISSAYDDICAFTLTALGCAWERLRYLAGLRASDGRYLHWGLARTYGEEAAQRALAQAHSELFIEILRTPLRRLAGQSSALDGPDWSAYLPADLEGGTPQHFSSIVSSLTALAEARGQSPSPAA